jgi:hypothetical protein
MQESSGYGMRTYSVEDRAFLPVSGFRRGRVFCIRGSPGARSPPRKPRGHEPKHRPSTPGRAVRLSALSLPSCLPLRLLLRH